MKTTTSSSMDAQQTQNSTNSNPNAVVTWHRGLVGPVRRLAGLLMVGCLSAAAWADDGDLNAGAEFLVREDTLLGQSDVAVNKHGEFIIAYDQLTQLRRGVDLSRRRQWRRGYQFRRLCAAI